MSPIVPARCPRGGKPAAPFALLCALASLAGGCTAIHDHRGYIVDPVMVKTILPGVDNRASVEQALGRPTFVSQFGQQNAYYVSEDTSQPPFHGPHPVRATVLRVRFDARGTVTAIDTAGVAQMVHVHPDGSLTPTLGRKRSLLEDLFGNIGTVGTGAGAGGPNGS